MNYDFQAVKVIDRTALQAMRPSSMDELSFRVVTTEGPWLDVTYALMQEVFERDVLDPIARYQEWLEQNRKGIHKFPFLMMVSYVVIEGTAYVLGIIAGNIMKVVGVDSNALGASANRYIFAIGHQYTANIVKEAGYKGLGTRLWQAAIEQVRSEVGKLSGTFEYSMLEAETDSLGYWHKLGYLWPKGVIYWQPPLEFDDQGNYMTPEVPEMLMLKAIDADNKDMIEKIFLQDIVRTVYENWSLDKYRYTLAPSAMKHADDYVMNDLFGRFCKRLPEDNPIPLVPINIGDGKVHKTGYRSMALEQGIRHGLEPLSPLDLSSVNSFSQLLQAMRGTAFGARNLGDAAEVLYHMAKDSDCKVVLTLSGAVSIAKMDSIIAEMIDRDMVHCIISTGAIICHGFNEERGSHHYKLGPNHSDSWLYTHGYNRIFDTIETEYALDELEDIVHSILSKQPEESTLGSCILMELLGEYLSSKGSSRGMIQSAYKKGVPIFIPAFTDSELGIDFATFNHYKRSAGKKEIRFNPFIDFERYCDFTKSNPVRGILTLGGGVPRNWAQQVGPYLDALERRQKGIAINPAQFKYGVRICPDPPYLGGLSGSTYSEGTSWGKFVTAEDGGKFAEVYADFSLVFPLLIKGLFERMQV